MEDILFLVSSLFELSDGSGVFLYCLRFNVDREVHVTAGLETGATNCGCRRCKLRISALQFTDKFLVPEGRFLEKLNLYRGFLS